MAKDEEMNIDFDYLFDRLVLLNHNSKTEECVPDCPICEKEMEEKKKEETDRFELMDFD